METRQSKGGKASQRLHKRFVIFAPVYLPHIGGVEIYVSNLASRLAARGDEVVVLTTALKGSPDHEMHDGVEVYRLPGLSLMDGRLPISRMSKKTLAILEKVFAKHVDGILANVRFYPLTLVALDVGKRFDVPVRVLDHGAAHISFGIPVLDSIVNAYEHAITLAEKHRGAEFYGISDSSSAWLRHFGIESQGVIGNAIDADAYRAQASVRSFREELGIGKDEVLIAFVGRLIKEKGLLELQEAARALAGEDMSFVIVGDGPLAGTLAKAALPSWHQVGQLDACDVAALLKEADVFCAPSYSEGFGSALAEAAVCETAIVASKTGIGPALVSPYDELLLDIPVSPVDIGAALLLVAEDDELRARAARHAKERAESLFSWDAVIKRFDQAFDDPQAEGSV